MWKFSEAYSQADPSWPPPFIAGTCRRAQVTRKPIWDFVFRELHSGAPILLGCFEWKIGPFLVFLQIEATIKMEKQTPNFLRSGTQVAAGRLFGSSGKNEANLGG